ncbi:hypothetical protein FRC01_008927 [Tulasnella sp. 417]|nr:hypothetical protein FRC01_008927 [Tulasnella sp. 417]
MTNRFSYISLPRLISERILEMIDKLQEKAEDDVTGFDTVHGSDAGQSVFSADGEEMPLTLGRYIRKEMVGKLTTTSPGYVTSDYHLVDLVILHRLQDRVQDVVDVAIKMHNEFCEEKWRLCQSITIVKKEDWKQYGNVDSSDAIMEYARRE